MPRLIPLLLIISVFRPFLPADDQAWVEPMQALHRNWGGTDKGYIAQYGDSITESMAFWSVFDWSDPDQYIGDDGLPVKPENKRWRDTIKGVRDKGALYGNKGGWRIENLLERVPKALAMKKPAAAVIMIGTNDIRGGNVPAAYREGLEKVVQLCLDAACIPIMTTIPPMKDRVKAAEECNAIIREIAAAKNVPLVDYYAAIMERRPADWLGTLVSDDGVHPTAGKTNDFSEENLKVSGYALRNWVTFQAWRQVYFKILMTVEATGPAAGAPAVGTAADGIQTETWDWASAMLDVTRNFRGDDGKVVPMGDSITYANQAGQYARRGKGRSGDENAACTWMHAAANDKTNGWWLAADDQPTGRSWTAASGATSEQYIEGGKGGLPSLAEIIRGHNPQIALILLGTNDASQGVAPARFLQNMETIYKACLANGTIPVVQTVPPTTWDKNKYIDQYNEGLVKLAAKHKLPLVDVYGEFLKRRPGDTWQNTLISGDGAHPTHTNCDGPPTDENLQNSGHLLRCWLLVNKVAAIKKQVMDRR